MRPTKANVRRRCEELGVEFDDAPGNVGIVAPEGHHFVADAYGWHYADWGIWPGSGWTRPEIYAAMLECMADGIEPCEPGCECGWDQDTE
jgi:hypothetical protein